MSPASIRCAEAECGIGADQLCTQAEATHIQGMQLPFVYPPQSLATRGEGFLQSAAFISEKIPGHEMSVPVGVHIEVAHRGPEY